eukprot:CAMPEP_0170095734 /NCGR_PEP_ID=MMETSP0019_2-20121128/28139_1 /TAXON_ID=98059 /ORGANISM="Dinobryon sp., Strain UTEXLB2267" /LENGTH=349 /DNA_ID=CAMNT_0010317535 /DNA_START=47 /DNA_END=1096 /DNA_ORIENTATION=-
MGAKSTAKEVIDTFGEGKYLAGKTAIVTGGNSGIGLEACKALASAGCKVILCSRSIKAGEAAIADEITKLGHGGYVVDPLNIVVKQLDLVSLQSIKSFADDVLSEARIDFLVLNAGIMALPKLERTESGFEKQIGVNHFVFSFLYHLILFVSSRFNMQGHFYLTLLLLDKLSQQCQAADPIHSRIVVLSSVAHSFGDVDSSDLHYTKGRKYSPWSAYGQSKSANILFTKALADRLKKRNLRISAVCLHPGEIQTNLWRASFVNRIAGSFLTKKTIPQGAATTVWACVCPRVETEGLQGQYLADCGPKVPTTACCKDATGSEREKLWKASWEDVNNALKKIGLPEVPPFE